MQSDFTEKTDNELVVLTLENQEYFVHIIDRYKRQLLAYIKRISGLGYEDAEDVLQEVFVKIYYNLNGFNIKLKFSSWAYRITHNTTMSEMRKRKVRPINYVETEDLVKIADKLDISKEIEHKDLQNEINGVLSKLDKKYREVLVLKFLEEKDYNEISDILKKPVGTVGTLINRAKKKFRELSS
ncbi:sigma-70 family RNA polymerase sigma factor [Candidatus Parcubacteria bacterium]|jgi:RNA polymerase sigma-70 factor, ECF subfamily|nr:sigma-70 family RNA polymerase sigma factor [Candidatus Parcubacteria bacterium]